MSVLDRARWNGLCDQIGTQKETAAWYDQLAGLYSEPHRHYHNAQHIADCLNEFDSARTIAREPLAIELALWFHDAVYDPRAPDNEERSAELAARFIVKTNAAKAIQPSVVQLVLATKTHDGSLHADAPLMVDIDLSIFGKSPERFWEYEKQIRKEYEWVPENIFKSKRAEILKRFLAREKIFNTELFFSKYEQPARANLAESIRRLCL
jgi:predicted metal-dependent HD superfamily phosphohydrolase